MGRTIRGALLGAISLFLVVVVIAAPIHVARGAEIDDRLQELDDLQTQIDDLQKQIQSAKNTEKSVSAELARLGQQLELSTRELNYIQAQISYTQDQIESTRNEIGATEQKLAAQKDAFDARLVSMYKAGRVSYVDILFTSGSLSEFMSRVHYLKQIAEQDNALIDEYAANRATLLAEQQDLQNKMTQYQTLAAQQEQKRTEVSSRSADRERYLASVQANREQLEQAEDEMDRQSKALEKVIADLQAKGQKPQAHKLAMMWPVSGGWITSYYGNRMHPVLGYVRWHGGIDYAAASGVPIKAMEDGTVLLAGWNGDYGNCVILDHGGGVSTLYGHASKILVKAGQDVVKGQTVALVGTTGLSTGPHLHFEVRVNGQTQDPLSWLPPAP